MQYQHIIRPKRKWLEVNLKDLWHYRDLYYMYVKRDVITQYKQTILGPLWYIIQPLLTAIMYMFVFGGLAGISTDGIPKPLFYLAGITLWNYFSGCFSSCSNVFGANCDVFGKVYFPRLVVPLSSCTSNLICMLIQFLIFITICIGFAIDGKFTVALSPALILIPLIIIITGLQAMSLGLLISSWTVKYRDLKFLISFGVQLLMYGTPVIYPLSFAPEKYRWILNLNPLAPTFEAFKYATLGVGTFNISGLLYSLVFLIVTLFFAVIVFNRTEQSFMDCI